MQMRQINNIDFKGILTALINGALDMGAGNIGLTVGNGHGDMGQDTFDIMTDDPDLDREYGCFPLVPGHIDPAFRITLQGQVTVGGVDRHTLAAGNETDNVITGNRVAAFAETHQYVVNTADLYRPGGL